MNTILQLTVRTHPGVMAHVISLFARRAFNVDGILCLPIGDGTQSRIWLRVQEDARLEQLTRQLQKLVDVTDVRLHGTDPQVFQKLEEFFKETKSP